MPQKGLNPPSRKATADVKSDRVWGSGKDFPQKFFPLPQNFNLYQILQRTLVFCKRIFLLER